MSIISDLLNCKKAVFIAADFEHEFILFQVATNRNGFFDEQYQCSAFLDDDKQKIKRLLNQNKYIITDCDETKELIITHYSINEDKIFSIIDISKKILPKYVFEERTFISTIDVSAIFFAMAIGSDIDSAGMIKWLIAATNELLYFYHYTKEIFPIKKRSPILDYLIEQNDSYELFASITPEEKKPDEKQSFISSCFSETGEYVFECQYHYNTAEAYFRRIQSMFNNIKYVICYGKESQQHIEGLYEKHNEKMNFSIIDLQEVASQIFKHPPSSLSLLFRRFLLTSWVDFCIEFELREDLLWVLENLLKEYKEVRNSLPE